MVKALYRKKLEDMNDASWKELEAKVVSMISPLPERPSSPSLLHTEPEPPATFSATTAQRHRRHRRSQPPASLNQPATITTAAPDHPRSAHPPRAAPVSPSRRLRPVVDREPPPFSCQPSRPHLRRRSTSSRPHTAVAQIPAATTPAASSGGETSHHRHSLQPPPPATTSPDSSSPALRSSHAPASPHQT
ncbi:uncharacterized protein LOC131164553 [Malania oleifera]|uniref:uncharacterized protein LOC131164553 n=1 Tax=Malania oleifera TaxID=397392 RepID=UPI0025AD9E0C|nr:uncharacterized protein LOC131164553 [Malania oleifera]